MKQVGILIKGVNDFARLRQRRSERWSFPDGIDRVVTMSQWHWEAYDSMVNGPWKGVDIAALNYHALVESQGYDANFESALLKGIPDGIVQAISITKRTRNEMVNDNSLLDWFYVVDR